MTKLLLLVVLSLTFARSPLPRGYLPRKCSSSVLSDYAEGSLKLTERVSGNEGLLVIQDSAIEPYLTGEGDKEEGSADELLETSGDLSSGSATGSGADGSAIDSLYGSAESGSGEGSGGGDEEDSTSDDVAAFREWLAAELVRMTTVIYDCRDGSETVGDWRNESVGAWLLGDSESRTKDSVSVAATEITSGNGRSELLPREREERFIFGEDDREFVIQSSDFPQCAVARVTTGCTAFFIGPYHALTAAHCVNNFRYGWRGPIRMWRERNCHDRGFYGSCSRVFAVKGHTHMKMYEYDYALVEMDRDGEPAPCWLGVGYVNPWDYPSEMDLEVLGYPSDKRRYTGQPECSYEAMWQAHCNVSYSIRQYLLHWCDVLSGNSGSPIFADVDGGKVVYGIHAHSVGDYVYNEDGRRKLEQLWNQGPMITPLRYHQILRWMKYEA